MDILELEKRLMDLRKIVHTYFSNKENIEVEGAFTPSIIIREKDMAITIVTSTFNKRGYYFEIEHHGSSVGDLFYSNKISPKEVAEHIIKFIEFTIK